MDAWYRFIPSFYYNLLHSLFTKRVCDVHVVPVLRFADHQFEQSTRHIPSLHYTTVYSIPVLYFRYVSVRSFIRFIFRNIRSIVVFLVVPFYVMLLITILVHYDLVDILIMIHCSHHIQPTETQPTSLIGRYREHQL
jgi:hypothetical protein